MTTQVPQHVDVRDRSGHRLQFRRARATATALIEAMDDGTRLEQPGDGLEVVPQSRPAVQENNRRQCARLARRPGSQPNAVIRRDHLHSATISIAVYSWSRATHSPQR
jgi:hypothetical protein